MSKELERVSDLMEDVEKIIPEDIMVDIGVEEIQSRNLYTIYVSDLKFYLEDLKFKKFCKILKKKYKDVYFIFCYKGNAFNNY